MYETPSDIIRIARDIAGKDADQEQRDWVAQHIESNPTFSLNSKTKSHGFLKSTEALRSARRRFEPRNFLTRGNDKISSSWDTYPDTYTTRGITFV